MERVVLAYSGGLDTSIAIRWLSETYRAEVVTVTMDLGQGQALDAIRDRAMAIGAVRAHVLDLREEFARDQILPALRACAIYEGRYPLATALGRPLIARHLVNIARIEGARLIAHGGTNEGNDHVRFETTARALDPSLVLVAPAMAWKFTRDEAIAYARERGISVPPGADGPYTIDKNLWGRSIMYPPLLEDTWQEAPEDLFQLTRSPADAPQVPAYVEIEFQQGVPTSINGVAMSFMELIQSLETIAGVHGVGRVDMIENRLVGMKSREVYEAPAAVVLHAAHKELQALVTPRDLERLTADLGVRYADLVYNGHWYGPTREAIDALVNKVQEKVTGVIRMKLFKGGCHVVGRSSPFALKDYSIVELPESQPAVPGLS
jgi:argininosuccinate synthase